MGMAMVELANLQIPLYGQSNMFAPSGGFREPGDRSARIIPGAYSAELRPGLVISLSQVEFFARIKEEDKLC
jgi:hypothetical protein